MEKDYSFLDTAERGMYFSKKEYTPKALNSYDEVISKLPHPNIAAQPLWTECYEYAIKVLFRNTHQPTNESGYVSNFVDAAFNKDIFLWDTSFMTMFCNFFHNYIPGICSLDNFYVKQFDDGEIPREMVRDTGKDFLLWINAYGKGLYSYFHKHYKFRGLKDVANVPYEELYKPNLDRELEKIPYCTLDNLNHPILAFAEIESYKQTGDVDRLKLVFSPLYHYYDALHYHLRHKSNLYVTDWASMDNSTRNKDLYLGVDISSEMVLFANHLIKIISILSEKGYEVEGKAEIIARLEKEKKETTDAIQKYMWDEKTHFFYDLDKDMKRIPIKTAAAFWTIISGVADEVQLEHLCWYLNDKETFNRLHRLPSLAANEPGYDPNGGYWRGSVWAPLNTMVTIGLEERGKLELAKEIALNDVDCTAKIFKTTGTIWENYPADFMTQGVSDHPDMVGWSGMAPIAFFIKYGVGLIPFGEKLVWNLNPEFIEKGVVECSNYYFNSTTVSLKAEKVDDKIRITATTDNAFELVINYGKESRNITVSRAIETLLDI